MWRRLGGGEGGDEREDSNDDDVKEEEEEDNLMVAHMRSPAMEVVVAMAMVAIVFD